MPIPIIAAVVTVVGGMIAQNVENKSAQANNTAQQQAAVANANTNWQKGNQQVAPFMPSGGGTPTGQTGTAPGAVKAAPQAGVSPQQVAQRVAGTQRPQAAPQAGAGQSLVPAPPAPQAPQVAGSSGQQPQQTQLTPQQLLAAQQMAKQIAGGVTG